MPEGTRRQTDCPHMRAAHGDGVVGSIAQRHCLRFNRAVLSSEVISKDRRSLYVFKGHEMLRNTVCYKQANANGLPSGVGARHECQVSKCGVARGNNARPVVCRILCGAGAKTNPKACCLNLFQVQRPRADSYPASLSMQLCRSRSQGVYAK